MVYYPGIFGETGERLTSGEAVHPRILMSDSQTLTAGQMVFGSWIAASSGVATTLQTCSAGTAGAGLTYAAAGIYSVDAAGNLTKLCDTGDLHGTLWAATFTNYVSTLATPFTRIAGVRYAVAVLVAGVTPPAIYAKAPQAAFAALAPVLCGCSTATNLTSLPATLAAAAQSGFPDIFPSAVVAP